MGEVVETNKEVEDKKEVKEEPKEEPKKEETKKEPKEPTLNITTKETFGGLLNAATSLMGEAKIQFAEAGMRLCAIDPANVCMIDLRLPSSEFEKYEITNDPEITVNITNLKKVIKDLGNKDVTIELMSGYLKVYKGRRRLSVPLLVEEENKFKKIPELKYGGYISPNKSLKDDITILCGLKAAVKFELGTDKLIMKCKGDTNTATFDAEGIVSGIKETQVSKFSEEYLKKIFSWKGDIRKIEIRTDYPLRVTFDFGICALAPRVSSD